MENEKSKKKPGCLIYLLAFIGAIDLVTGGINKVAKFYDPSNLLFQKVREIKEVRDINNDGLLDITLGLADLVEDKTEIFFGTEKGYKTLDQIEKDTRELLYRRERTKYIRYKKSRESLEKELQERIAKYKTPKNQ